MSAQTIWKFPLPLAQHAVVEMPIGAQPLSAGIDPATPGGLAVWARVWPDAKTTLRRFDVCGTGHPCPGYDDGYAEFVGTVIDQGYVWHIFDRGVIPGGEPVEQEVRGL